VDNINITFKCVSRTGHARIRTDCLDSPKIPKIPVTRARDRTAFRSTRNVLQRYSNIIIDQYNIIIELDSIVIIIAIIGRCTWMTYRNSLQYIYIAVVGWEGGGEGKW